MYVLTGVIFVISPYQKTRSEEEDGYLGLMILMIRIYLCVFFLVRSIYQ